MIKVYTDEFVAAVKGVLEGLKPGYFVTAEQLVKEVGLDGSRKSLIADMFAHGVLVGFESVKSRGIRRVKGNEQTVAPVTPVAELATAAE